MTVPATNTPETFAVFMQNELERQRDLAKLSAHQSPIKCGYVPPALTAA